jgi:hypothetical protein
MICFRSVFAETWSHDAHGPAMEPKRLENFSFGVIAEDVHPHVLSGVTVFPSAMALANRPQNGPRDREGRSQDARLAKQRWS